MKHKINNQGATVIGDELALHSKLGLLERTYIRVFGVPINGLRIRLRRILPILSGHPEKVLDAGCGRGVFSYQIAKMFPEAVVVGVDRDEAQLEINRTIADRARLTNLHFINMDVAKLAYDNEFDLVLSVDNLEHIENDLIAIQHLAKALKEGGSLIMHVPGRERRWFFLNFKDNFDVPGHYRPGYTLPDIRCKVESAGLKVSYAYYTYGLLETLTNNISYLITRAEAKNRLAYAMCFPFLNIISWFGRNSRPAKGAGVLLTARKNNTL